MREIPIYIILPHNTAAKLQKGRLKSVSWFSDGIYFVYRIMSSCRTLDSGFRHVVRTVRQRQRTGIFRPFEAFLAV